MAKYFKYPFAQDGDKSTVPDAPQPDGSVSWDEGFPIKYSQDPTTTGLDIARLPFNEILYEITNALKTVQQQGFPDFITSTDNGGTPYSYSINATCRYNGVNYYSLVNGNTDTPPSANWGVVTYGSQFQTGDSLYWQYNTIRSGGWLWENGTTIGSAASGATQRANADTLNLYTMLWTDYSNAVLPIQDSTGAPSTRGISAAADFAANKRMPLLNKMNAVVVMKDGAGGAALTNRLTVGGSGIAGGTGGSFGGSQTVALTDAQNGPHIHTGSTDSAGAHQHTYDTYHEPNDVVGAALGSSYFTGTQPTSIAGAHTHTFTTSSSGTGAAHNNTQPTLVTNGGWIVKI